MADLNGCFIHQIRCTGRAVEIPIPKWISVRTATAYGLVWCASCRTHRFDVQLANGELHSLHARWPLDRLVDYVRINIEGGKRLSINATSGEYEYVMIEARV